MIFSGFDETGSRELIATPINGLVGDMKTSLILISIVALGVTPAAGQPGHIPAPVPAPAPALSPAPAPAPLPTPAPAPAPAPAADRIPDSIEAPAHQGHSQSSTEPVSTSSGVRIHVLSTRNAYIPMKYDVFSVESRELVFSGQGALEGRGEAATVSEVPPGKYKVVRAGESFDAKVDYAVVVVEPNTISDFVIVVDPDTLEFRGSGPMIDTLPKGVSIAGVRLSLNGGGNLLFNQKVQAVGSTSGSTTQFGVFGNFGLVVDKGVHFLDVNADLKLDLVDPITGSVAPTHDLFQASGLYSYKLNNPYLGPYVRGSMKTRIFPGYLYLERAAATGTVLISRLDGTTETRTFGAQANPDDLRIKVAEAFAPLQLQEEVGANVKAIDLDLLLLKLNVSTRIGFGFRQGVMNGLLVVDSAQSSDPVRLREVDNYATLGPIIGANANVTFARWLFGAAQFGLLAPVMNTSKSASDNFGGRLLVDFSGTAGFKVPILTNLLYASADYSFRLERDAFITNRTQFEHAVMARANITLF